MVSFSPLVSILCILSLILISANASRNERRRSRRKLVRPVDIREDPNDCCGKKSKGSKGGKKGDDTPTPAPTFCICLDDNGYCGKKGGKKGDSDDGKDAIIDECSSEAPTKVPTVAPFGANTGGPNAFVFPTASPSNNPTPRPITNGDVPIFLPPWVVEDWEGEEVE
uniref:Uncharacterized protein n=1 Tax=Ditylum brightwellii TaxID=49249 RepID=A0A6U3NU38_9STRA|mmetsp:Transcript_1177/g.1929  ORF Transcript_1177/g.1929 Transcript_1177/m.1929 type:complete len:167 (+) Transcript_1177:42-542(+)